MLFPTEVIHFARATAHLRPRIVVPLWNIADFEGKDLIELSGLERKWKVMI